jgi:poly-beta-hydroxybutyrate-responsive repressor
MWKLSMARPRSRSSSPNQDNRGSSAFTEKAQAGSAETSFNWPLRDFLVSCILLTLSMQRAHGYLIEQSLQNMGLINVEMSTLYRTLRKLEKEGLVSSTWEPGPEGPARRVYTLTDAGHWWLEMGASAMRGYRDIIDHFLASYRE